ncbi:PREDICTED: uncharacterized protein LOC109220231 [Nicotiana attenuata]|uniref:uncharacterized protein LOC109220231 n=1 Tax=Nicotiana attenuata TaxID=49451 RepID=UPI00090547E1|nr:PREDICTED: uncharacterized protein LOC109220231 [Nicotiana attenuata]
MPSRQKKRKREKTKHPKFGKLSRRGMEMTCSLCGVFGHNKRGCPNKKSATRNVAAGNAAAGNATTGNGRGRGRKRGTSNTTTSSSQSARGRGVSAIGRGVGRGRGSEIGLFQARNEFTSFTSGGQNPRVISTGTKTKRSTASTEECAYQPRSTGLRWMGQKAISTRQIQRNATSQHNLSQASSSSQPTKKKKKK